MTTVRSLLSAGWSWQGALIGLMLAVGLDLIVVGLPVFRRTGLEARLEPYLRDAPRPSRLLATGRAAGIPGLGISRVFGPMLSDLAAGVERVLGGAASVRRRLQRAGQPPDVERFRAEQVIWGAVGGLAEIVLGALAVVARNTPALPVVFLVLCFFGAGIVARDQWLSHVADVREQRMLSEFPTVAGCLLSPSARVRERPVHSSGCAGSRTVSSRPNSPPAWPTPGREPTSRQPSKGSPTAPGWSAWRGSSTASSSRSSAEPRSRRCSGARRRTCVRPGGGPSWSRAARRRSR